MAQGGYKKKLFPSNVKKKLLYAILYLEDTIIFLYLCQEEENPKTWQRSDLKTPLCNDAHNKNHLSRGKAGAVLLPVAFDINRDVAAHVSVCLSAPLYSESKPNGEGTGLVGLFA